MSLAQLKKQAEKKAKERELRGSNLAGSHIQGLMLEPDLMRVDSILINELKFIRADGTIIDYVLPVEVESGEGR